MVYAVIEAYASGVPAAQVWRSTNAGQTYVQTATQDLLSNQGYYDNVVWVDPTNANTLLVGGVELYRSTDGGASFARISGGNFHPDHHVIVHDPGFNGTTNKRIFVGNDGGIFRVDDVYAAAPPGTGIPYTVLNTNYGTAQFYGGAALASGQVMGGSQDNGSHRYTGALGPQIWEFVEGGDGGFLAPDPIVATTYYGTSQLLNLWRIEAPEINYALYLTGCNKLAPYRLEDACTFAVNFIAPIVTDQTGRLLAGGRSLWKTDNPRAVLTSTTGPVWASIKGPIGDAQGGKISAIAVAQTTANVIWVGHNNGDVYVTYDGLSPSPTWFRVDTNSPPLPNRAVSSIAIDPTDANRAYVSFGGYSPDNLWVTSNGGATWLDATGSGGAELPSAPTRWVTVHPTLANFVYAATDVGIFASEDGGATWQLPHGGPANVATFQLFWMGTTLVAATHGRGMFSATTTVAPVITTQPASQTINAGATATLMVAASGSKPFAYQWYRGTSPGMAFPITGATGASFTTPPLDASTNYWVRVTNAGGAANSATAAVSVITSAYDATLQAPKCGTVGNECDSGPVLLNGRGNITGGPEPNQPNTIYSTCADGMSGTYHVDESIDRLRVFTLDGTPFAPGKTVQIAATVFAFSANDHLDLYYAANAAAPVWTFIATVSAPGGGVRLLTANYVLPAGSMQAIRANFRFTGAPDPCTGGAYNDHDDLIFAVGPAAETELVQNGTFSSGLANWSLFETPPGNMPNQVSGGVFEFYRAGNSSTQATIFQTTGWGVAARTTLVASFQLGNSDVVRQRMSVLIIDADFSDITVCTFWLEPGAPMRSYVMATTTTKAWANAAIYFYAASTGTGAGWNRLDNVSLKPQSYVVNQTACFDPTAPPAPGGADGPTLLVNGDFATGSLAPWGTFGTLTQQIVAGVLEFIRPTATPPAGVVLQSTGQAMTQGQLLTATFMLGNSSGVRKRVTVLLHDLNFTDLAACTFWIPPGEPLRAYSMVAFATQAWTNATVSFYAATVGPAGWTRLDDGTFKRTPGGISIGTICNEPAPPAIGGG